MRPASWSPSGETPENVLSDTASTTSSFSSIDVKRLNQIIKRIRSRGSWGISRRVERALATCELSNLCADDPTSRDIARESGASLRYLSTA